MMPLVVEFARRVRESWSTLGRRSRPRRLRQTRALNCVQTVFAMALDLPIDVVETEVGTTGAMRMREVRWLLERLAITAPIWRATLVADCWDTCYQGGARRRLLAIGLRMSQDPSERGHAYLLSGSALYDPLTGTSRRMTDALIRERLHFVVLLPANARSHERVTALRPASHRESRRGSVPSAPRIAPAFG